MSMGVELVTTTNTTQIGGSSMKSIKINPNPAADPSSSREAGRSIRTLATILFVLALFVAGSVLAEDWVQVASGGLGDSSRGKVSLALFDGHIYAAATGSTGNAAVFRAPVTADRTWSDVTPPWRRTGSGKVTDMVVFGSHLFVANYLGEVWRFSERSGWYDVTPPWGSSSKVLALAEWSRPSGRTLCALLTGIELWCRVGGAAVRVSVTTMLRSDPSIGSARLHGFDGALYVGLGGATVDSRHCEVWRVDEPSYWRVVTGSCFGSPGLTWVSSMQESHGYLYIGTGGHRDTPLVMRTDGTRLEDVTPYTLYSCGSGPCPLRYGSMADSGGRLYVGTRTRDIGPPVADVLGTRDGTSWDFSNSPGFGDPLNDTTTALAGERYRLYAGVLHRETGFQVWRRNSRLYELIPYLEGSFERLDIMPRLEPCLALPGCRIDWPPVQEPLWEFAAIFEFARQSKADAELAGYLQKLTDAAIRRLATARELAESADKLGEKEALAQRKEALSYLRKAYDLAQQAFEQALEAGTYSVGDNLAP